MRIFIIHNYYQDKGGEDVVFAQEAEALKQRHQVQIAHAKNKKGFIGLLQFFLYPWNIFMANRLLRQIKSFGADIVHVHNIHYTIGPWLFRLLYKNKIPVVFTLHNFRLLDPSATLFYNNQTFTDTIYLDFPWKSIKNKVLDNSYFKTFWTAFTYYLHKKLNTWQHVDRYLTFSQFSKRLLAESSLKINTDKISVKPNAVPAVDMSTTIRSDYFLYIGRLSDEKGITPLTEAFAHNNYKLKIFGDGPLREEVIRLSENHPQIEYGGFQQKETLMQHLNECQALIVPSIWFEGMPMTVLEAYATSTPVLASNIGILAEIVEEGVTGYHFEPNSPTSILKVLQDWSSLSQDQKTILSENCHKTYLDKYSLEKNVLLLEEIYRETILTKK